MDVMIKRLDPHVPDPVESRRRAAGRLVRFTYGIIVFGVIGFFVVYFGKPLVFLGGAGVVSSARHVVSLPYLVHITRMDVAPGAEVKTGEEIGQVRSPQMDGVVATYMRALTDLTGREAELRIKARVAGDSLEASRSYLRLTEEAVQRIEAMASSNISVSYQVEIHRERALARKAVVSQEAEVAEAAVQLASLAELGRQLRARLGEVERDFGNGRVVAPIGGIVSTKLASVGQSLAAGNAIAEILDPSDVFVDWYIPNYRLFDPEVGNEVFVLFGNRRIPGKIAEILPVSDVYAGAQPVFASHRQATQIARVRFNPGVTPPALNATVHVHMYYSNLAAWIATTLVDLFGLE